MLQLQCFRTHFPHPRITLHHLTSSRAAFGILLLVIMHHLSFIPIAGCRDIVHFFMNHKPFQYSLMSDAPSVHCT